MTIRQPFTLALLLLLPVSADAEERRVGLGSFDRVRIEGPYRVTIATGGSPGAVLRSDGSLDGVELHTERGTLMLRRAASAGWGERRTAAGGPVTVALTTPALAGLSAAGGAEVSVTRMAAPRIDVTLGGSGRIAIDTVAGDQLNAQLIGDGQIRFGAGKVGTLRLTASGTGGIDAGSIDAGDAVVHLAGSGAIAARARYTATVSNAGLGMVSVAGQPKCRLVGQPTGTVTCGTER